jgi:hypothetical protein
VRWQHSPLRRSVARPRRGSGARPVPTGGRMGERRSMGAGGGWGVGRAEGDEQIHFHMSSALKSSFAAFSSFTSLSFQPLAASISV